MRPMSNLNDPVWTSTARLSYKKPSSRSKPTARVRSTTPGHGQLFDNNLRRNDKPQAKASGFVANTNLLYRINWAQKAKQRNNVS